MNPYQAPSDASHETSQERDGATVSLWRVWIGVMGSVCSVVGFLLPMTSSLTGFTIGAARTVGLTLFIAGACATTASLAVSFPRRSGSKRSKGATAVGPLDD